MHAYYCTATNVPLNFVRKHYAVYSICLGTAVLYRNNNWGRFCIYYTRTSLLILAFGILDTRTSIRGINNC